MMFRRTMQVFPLRWVLVIAVGVMLLMSIACAQDEFEIESNEVENSFGNGGLGSSTEGGDGDWIRSRSAEDSLRRAPFMVKSSDAITESDGLEFMRRYSELEVCYSLYLT